MNKALAIIGCSGTAIVSTFAAWKLGEAGGWLWPFFFGLAMFSMLMGCGTAISQQGEEDI